MPRVRSTITSHLKQGSVLSIPQRFKKRPMIYQIWPKRQYLFDFCHTTGVQRLRNGRGDALVGEGGIQADDFGGSRAVPGRIYLQFNFNRVCQRSIFRIHRAAVIPAEHDKLARRCDGGSGGMPHIGVVIDGLGAPGTKHRHV